MCWLVLNYSHFTLSLIFHYLLLCFMDSSFMVYRFIHEYNTFISENKSAAIVDVVDLALIDTDTHTHKHTIFHSTLLIFFCGRQDGTICNVIHTNRIYIYLFYDAKCYRLYFSFYGGKKFEAIGRLI